VVRKGAIILTKHMRSRGKIRVNNKRVRFSSAFTIIELIVVVAIIAILAAIVIVSYSSWRQSTTVSQLKSDLNNAASAMENYRNFNSGYPADITTITTFTPSSGVTLSGGSSDGGITYCVSAVSSQFPSLYYHIDTTNSGTGAVAGICLSQRTLNTIAGAGGTVSSGGSFNLNSVQTITATPNTNYAFNSWTGDTGCSGTASHTITMDANKICTASFTATAYVLTIVAGSGGTVNSGGTYTPGSTQTITATPNSYYSFVSWTGDTGCSGIASHTITMDNNKTCTANFTPTDITPPSAPTVTPNTVGATTTYSWGAASCPGNTARYQYDYTIPAISFDSGWVATASTSVGFTTSTENQTYIVNVQAQCYNAVTSSSWSGSGQGSYYRPISSFMVLVVAGGGGGGDDSGTYGLGSGGGAGGLIYNASYVISNGTYTVTVGNGGAIRTNGGNSVLSGLTAIGGGHGVPDTQAGVAGGSGGGSGYSYSSSTLPGGTGSQGYNGGTGDCNGGGCGSGIGDGGGGGGAGGAGASGVGITTEMGVPGGVGLQYSISGTARYYAGGGGGACSLGGNGGGGGSGTICNAQNGAVNTGGGGGDVGSGGSGIVIISYPSGTKTFSGGTVTNSGGRTINTFYSTGTLVIN
jgi:prepilin-type N-terminal cleavage/methylation domain-containing protein